MPDSDNGATAVPKFQFAGSVSSGTHRPVDLIDNLSPVLKALNPKRFFSLAMNRPDDDQEYVIQLMDALDLESPEGMYFGTHQGDGADFGFWEEYR